MASAVGKFQTVFSSPKRMKAEAVLEKLRRAGYHPLPIGRRRAPVYRVDLPIEELRAAREVLVGADI
jgi:hypothetical protein